MRNTAVKKCTVSLLLCLTKSGKWGLNCSDSSIACAQNFGSRIRNYGHRVPDDGTSQQLTTFRKSVLLSSSGLKCLRCGYSQFIRSSRSVVTLLGKVWCCLVLQQVIQTDMCIVLVLLFENVRVLNFGPEKGVVRAGFFSSNIRVTKSTRMN